MKSVVQGGYRFARMTATAHADFVEAITLRMITHRERKRQRVFDYNRIAADIRLSAHATELMDARIGANVRAVSDDYVTGECGGIGHDHLIANQAIVRDMRLGHEEAIVPGLGDSAAARGAAMNCDQLADAIAPPNFSFSCFTGKLQILRRQTDRHKREDFSFIANS